MTAPMHRDFNPGEPFPSAVVDALFRMLSSYVSPSFVVRQFTAQSVYVQAIGQDVSLGGDLPVGLTIQGQMAFSDSATAITTTLSGGAGTRYIWATAPVLSESAEDSGSWDYSFSLTSTTTATKPATVRARLVATVPWDGSQISGQITQTTLPPGAPTGEVPVGGMVDWGGQGDPANSQWLAADGRTFTAAARPELAAALGTRYAWPGDAAGTYRLPDTRGRVLVGNQTGPSTGAVSLLTSSAPDVGQRGGVGSLVLASAHMPIHSHGGATGGMSANNPHQHWDGAGGSTASFAGPPGPFWGNADLPGRASDPADIQHTHSIAAEGGNVAHTNLQPYVIVSKIIRVR